LPDYTFVEIENARLRLGDSHASRKIDTLEGNTKLGGPLADSEKESENQDISGEDETPSSSEQAGTDGSNRRKVLFVVGGTAVAAIAIAGALVFLTAPSKLQQDSEECFSGSTAYFSIDDDGQGLFIDGSGEETPGATQSATFCVLDELEILESVTSRIYNTNSTMGQQEASWEGITALWTYHPDRGLDVSLTLD